MTPYRGQVHNGVIVVDGNMPLREGTRVIIEPARRNVSDRTGVAGSWVDERSADEIIKDIKEARHSKK